jgi:hypothetical protein
MFDTLLFAIYLIAHRAINTLAMRCFRCKKAKEFKLASYLQNSAVQPTFH